MNENLIPVANPYIGDIEKKYLFKALEKGEISSQGSFVGELEERFADYCNTSNAILVSNGTVAIHLALVAMGIKENDEVIVPAFTFISTANAVKHAGAEPIFVDVDPNSWTIDPKKIQDKVTEKTKCIIPVHVYGHPAKMDEINDIASKNSLIVIEDAAEAHGALFKGKKVGGIGNAATFSFFANKIITTGEGGAITTNDDKLAAKIKILRDHGKTPGNSYWHEVLGYNYRLTNLQAALGLAQLKRIEDIMSKKSHINELYNKGFKDLPISFQPNADWAKSVTWLVTILLDNNSPITSQELRNQLKKKRIDSRPLFVPLPKLPVYDYCNDKFPTAKDLNSRGLNLPSGPNISSDDIEYVIESVREIFSK